MSECIERLLHSPSVCSSCSDLTCCGTVNTAAAWKVLFSELPHDLIPESYTDRRASFIGTGSYSFPMCTAGFTPATMEIKSNRTTGGGGHILSLSPPTQITCYVYVQNR